MKASDTFNRAAAVSAIPLFCKSTPYTSDKHTLNTCAATQNYVFDGSKINSGGQSGTLGNFERIFFAMRWDFGVCTNNDWWGSDAVDDDASSPAGRYLAGPTAYDDCVKGLTAALDGCKCMRI